VERRHLLALSAVGFSVFLIALTAGLSAPGAGGAAPSAGSTQGARFVTRCTYSHTLSDDPIVHPNQPGASHSHDFFGNKTTDAFSTLASLTKGAEPPA